MTRDEVLENSKSLLAENHNIALQLPTNFGKSRIAIEIIHFLSNTHRLSETPKVLLVVNEVPHKANWQEEFNKWGKITDLTVICYASLKNYINTDWDAIIWDEAHHLGTPLRIGFLETITSGYNLFLSATLSYDLIEVLQTIVGKIATCKISLKEAINSKIIAEPTIYLIKLNLNTRERTEIIEEEWGSKSKRITYTVDYPDRWKYKRNKRAYPDVKLIIKCTEFEKYHYLCEQVEYWKKRFMSERQEFIKNKWMQMGSLRKKYLGELKTPYANQIINKIKNKRFICFCTSILQSEALGSKTCIHSKRADSLNIINKFNEGKTNSLFACQMIKEGQNLKNIEVGIIIQLDGQELSFIQRVGRTLRAEKPIQFILYYNNTRDSEYLENAMKNVDSKYVHTITMNELKDLSL